MSVINSVQLPADNTQITDQLNTLAGAVADIQNTVDGMGTNTVQVVDGQGEMTASLTEINSKLEGAAVVADGYIAHPLKVVGDAGGDPFGEELFSDVNVIVVNGALVGGEYQFSSTEGYREFIKVSLTGLTSGAYYSVSSVFYGEAGGKVYIKDRVDNVETILLSHVSTSENVPVQVGFQAGASDMSLIFKNSEVDNYHLKDISIRRVSRAATVLPRNENRISANIQIDAPCYVESEDGIVVDRGLEWNNRDPLRLISVSGDPVNVRVSEEEKA